MELYKKHRPKNLKQVRGNREAKKTLRTWATTEFPHFMLFAGPSGCGKTTVARIVAKRLGCGPGDFEELNAASTGRGIDTIKRIESQMRLAPLHGDCRVYYFDESHNMTKDAQTAGLKMLEDTPASVFFIFATTEPKRMLPTIQTRANIVTMSPLNDKDMLGLLSDVSEVEGIGMDDDALDVIIAHSGGSSRQALVYLDQCRDMSVDEVQKFVGRQDANEQAIELARALMSKKSWTVVSGLLKAIDEEPEGLRRMILGYAGKVMLGGGKMAPRAFVLVDQFGSNYFDTGRAGLIGDCFAVCHQ